MKAKCTECHLRTFVRQTRGTVLKEIKCSNCGASLEKISVVKYDEHSATFLYKNSKGQTFYENNDKPGHLKPAS